MTTKYVSKKPDEQGIYHYTDVENDTWKTLYARQTQLIAKYGCDEYLEGQQKLNLPADHVPQLKDVTAALQKATQWGVANVPALISYDRFFKLLADRKFPAATFIRIPEELDYLEEPDVFHEIFGHCPLLTDPVYANFMEAYGKIGMNASPHYQKLLMRLYWFTVEFGLIKSKKGLRAYGAGILSSIGETQFAIESSEPQRKPLDIIDALRTPYRIDIFQSVYFVIDSFDQLFELVNKDLIAKIDKAIALGEHAPTYPPKQQAQS
jgi:phenylalanine-4-hydroxylase